jgi:hypothetical protein
MSKKPWIERNPYVPALSRLQSETAESDQPTQRRAGGRDQIQLWHGGARTLTRVLDVETRRDA